MAKETTAAPAKAEVYEAKEIAKASMALFGYGTDIATAALAYNKVERCTIIDAKRIIKEFAERKV